MFCEVNCVGEGDEYLHLYSTCEETEHPHYKLYATLNECPDRMSSGASYTAHSELESILRRCGGLPREGEDAHSWLQRKQAIIKGLQ